MKRKPSTVPASSSPDGLSRNRLRRLRQYCRSARWSCQDNVEHAVWWSVWRVTTCRHLHPALHAIKVRRADLLGDLKNESKRRGGQSCSHSFHYVLAEGSAEPAEIPADCGLIVASERNLRIERPAPFRPATLTTAQWVALARAGAEFGDDDAPQYSF